MRALEQSLPLKLLKAREAVMEQFRPHLAAHDLTEQQWRVLRALAEADVVETRTLADRAVLLMPSLSRMLPDLEARGLIARRRGTNDARTVAVGLAPKGRALFDAMSAESERIYREIEQTVGRSVITQIMGDLDRLMSSLDSKRASEAMIKKPKVGPHVAVTRT
jgi:homoprotocatechuate degradation regulator HpaR